MLSVDPEVWRQLSQHIEDARADHVERMARGACATWEQYQREVGYVLALDEVVRGAEEIIGRMSGRPLEEDEED